MKTSDKRLIGNSVIILAILLPVFIWISMAPIISRFSSWSISMTSLGQLSALVGMALFSITLILSARFKFLEKYFGGQGRAYIKHHYLGATAFILLIFHPLFLVVKYLMISLLAAAQFISPWLQDVSVKFGTISLLLMMISLFFTFYKKLPYHIWKQTHRFLGLSFLFGSLHTFHIESDISRNAFLRGYMLTLIILGIFSVIYRVVLKRILVKTYSYIVESVRKPINNVYEIILKPRDINKVISYKAGQFAFVSFNSSLLSGEYHPFSMTSKPKDHELSFTVKALGDYTNNLDDLKPGDTANVEGSFGVFTMDSSYNLKQIWIAGGIGITPFLSMARSIDVQDKKYSIDLYYSVKTEDEFVFLKELEDISKKTGQLKIFPVVTSRDGFINADIIIKNSGTNADIFICGPLIMMRSLRDQFISRGISSRNIHTEEFSLQ